MSDEKKWYSLRVISGKERKIKERLDAEIKREGWDAFIAQTVVPAERVYKVRNGKKVLQERTILPGYILVEATDGKLVGEISQLISSMTNVMHFLGKEHPIPMTQVEAKRILGIIDDAQSNVDVMFEPFVIGEDVKLISGPFENFVGTIESIDKEKQKLHVIVRIFDRGTPMEVDFAEVEKQEQ